MLLMTSCAKDVKRQVDDAYQHVMNRTDHMINQVKEEPSHPPAFWIDDQKDAYIVSVQGSRPLFSSHCFPGDAKMMTIHFAHEYDFLYWLHILQNDTGIPMHVMADVPQDLLHGKKMMIYYQGALTGLLDQIAEYYHVFWRYHNNHIEFFHNKTEIFNINLIPGQVKQIVSIGQKSEDGHGSVSSAHVIDAHHFYSDNQSQLNASLDIWSSLKKQIQTILPQPAFFSMNPSTGTLVVRADPDSLSVIHHLVDDVNARLATEIRLKIDVLSLSFDQDSADGFQWHLIYNQLAALAHGVSAEIQGNAADWDSGDIQQGAQLSVLDEHSPWQGSTLMMNALRRLAKVHIDRSVIVTTLNRQPVPIGITNQLTYLAETTPAITPTGQSGIVSTGVGLIPGVVSYGFVMNALPIILDRRHIVLQFVLNISDLKKLSVIETGQGYSLQKIQTPEISSVEFVHRALLSSGEPMLLSAYEKSQGNSAHGVGLGGFGQKARRSHDVIVILVTPWFHYHV